MIFQSSPNYAHVFLILLKYKKCPIYEIAVPADAEEYSVSVAPQSREEVRMITKGRINKGRRRKSVKSDVKE